MVKDAGSSATALLEWTEFDFETHPYDEINHIVDRYLARDYYNPLTEAEVKGIRFDLLKCLDLYHSKELDTVIKHVVIKPNHTYRQDNPPETKSK